MVKDRKGVRVVNEDALSSVGPEHDVNDVEQRVEIALDLAEMEWIFFVAAPYCAVFWIYAQNC